MINFAAPSAAIHDAPTSQPTQSDLEAADQPPYTQAVPVIPAVFQNLPRRPRAFTGGRRIAETVAIAGATVGCAAGAATVVLTFEGNPGWKPAMALGLAAFGINFSARDYLRRLHPHAADPQLPATCPPSPQEGALPDHHAGPQYHAPA